MPADGARPASTAAFLRRCLDTMRRRSPDRYAGVVGLLERGPAHVCVGEDRFSVSARNDRVSVRAGWHGEARSRVDASESTLVALVDGTRSLREVLADESLVVRGGADALLDLAAAASALAAEVAATPGYADQIEEYRSWAAAR